MHTCIQIAVQPGNVVRTLLSRVGRHTPLTFPHMAHAASGYAGKVQGQVCSTPYPHQGIARMSMQPTLLATAGTCTLLLLPFSPRCAPHLGQVPVVHGGVGRDAGGQHGVQEGVVVRHPRRVEGAARNPLRQQAVPAEAEPVAWQVWVCMRKTACRGVAAASTSLTADPSTGRDMFQATVSVVVDHGSRKSCRRDTISALVHLSRHVSHTKQPL